MIAKSLVIQIITLGCCLSTTHGSFAQESTQSALRVGVPQTEQAPFVEDGETATPYLTLSGLKSWIVTDQQGNRRLVFTTQDGMTLDGPLRDQQGRSLSDALLGTASPAAIASTPSGAASATDQTATESNVVEPPPTAQAAPDDAAPQVATQEAAIASNAAPSIKPAASVDDLLAEAGRKVWFSAGEAKPGAPVLYFMADPTCIHCAASTEKLAPYIESGDMDVRVILAPIRNSRAVFEAASLLQSQNIRSDFISHERAQVGSTSSSLQVLEPSQINADVVRGLQHNVAWGRANGVAGVPFWIYESPNGAKVAAGRITDAIIKDVRPLPIALAQETAQ